MEIDSKLQKKAKKLSDASGGGPVVRSPLKWAGGKSRLLATIAAQVPGELSFSRFVDVFSGSGVVAANPPVHVSSVWMNDFNSDLTTLYSCLRDDAPRLITEAKSLFSGTGNDREVFVRLRTEFNERRRGEDFRRAAIFIYLNRHGFNGLCRYNSEGGFNAPFGRYTKAPVLDDEVISLFVARLQGVKITNLSFADVLADCGTGDLVYLDPPYSPLEQNSNFTAYVGGGFGAEEHRRLATMAEEAARRGALVIISNHDTPFTRELYRRADSISSFKVGRSISRQKRKSVHELMAVYRPDRP